MENTQESTDYALVYRRLGEHFRMLGENKIDPVCKTEGIYLEYNLYVKKVVGSRGDCWNFTYRVHSFFREIRFPIEHSWLSPLWAYKLYKWKGDLWGNNKYGKTRRQACIQLSDYLYNISSGAEGIRYDKKRRQ